MTVGPNRRADLNSAWVITAGGTHTGGTEFDALHVKTGTNQGNQSSRSAGDSASDERGIAPAAYHLVFTAAAGDPVVGTFRMRWEERS